MCIACHSGPTGAAQVYLKKISGKLSQLNDINEISRAEYTTDYTLKRHYVHERGIGVYLLANRSGRYNGNYNMYIHVVLPIFTDTKDTVGLNAAAWLGMSYHKSISSKLSQEEKGLAFKSFYEETMIAVEHESFNSFSYLERPAYNWNSERFNKALVNSPYYQFKNQVILEGVKSPFKSRLNASYRFMTVSFLTGSFIWLMLILIPGWKHEEDQIINPETEA